VNNEQREVVDGRVHGGSGSGGGTVDGSIGAAE